MPELSVCELDTQCGELLPERETLAIVYPGPGGGFGLNISVDPTTVVGNQVGFNISALTNGAVQSVSQWEHFSAY